MKLSLRSRFDRAVGPVMKWFMASLACLSVSTSYAQVYTHTGTGAGDASTAIPVGPDYMFVASDDNQSIKLFHRNQNDAAPVASFDFSVNIGLQTTDKADIEASTKAYVNG